MRNDERFEIQRAFDLIPYVVGASWATVWFRMNENKKPTREEFREKTLEYLKMMEPIFDSYPNEKNFEAIKKYIELRKKEEYEALIKGANKEIEKRYDRYVDYG